MLRSYCRWHSGKGRQSELDVEQTLGVDDRPRFGPTDQRDGGALRVPALRRAPGTRSLCVVFYGRPLLTTVAIKSARNGAELTLGVAHDRAKSGYYVASLRGVSLSATVEVYDHDVAHVVQYFADLGEGWWTGWPGEKAYSSVEGNLELAARRDKAG